LRGHLSDAAQTPSDWFRETCREKSQLLLGNCLEIAKPFPECCLAPSAHISSGIRRQGRGSLLENRRTLDGQENLTFVRSQASTLSRNQFSHGLVVRLRSLEHLAVVVAALNFAMLTMKPQCNLVDA
jgi:hypothetical protein